MPKFRQNLTIYVNVLNFFKKSLLVDYVQRFSNFAKLYTQKSANMKVLNVAEKNDAAKNIAGYLSRGTAQRREGLSKFNKIYEFNVHLWNQNCKMVMTSVSGHLMGYEFVGSYRKWYGCPPLSLFEAPIVKQCIDSSYEKIKKTLEKEIKSCNALIIWTDCDREGENIAFEIIQVCQAIKANIRVYRAKFSEITQVSIDRALLTLEEPNKALSDAVDVRSELDLRIGAAFTRFQTMRLQKVFPKNLADMLISYGPCQFPTLGFVVERFLAIERFESEPYWKLKVIHEQDNLSVEFRWARNRLFEKLPCEVFLDICQENPQATVEKVTSKPKSKWRPLPLDTIELEKQGSRKLHLSAKETMKIAEKLYSQGFISYPRTETNIFPKELNLVPLVTMQTSENNGWGAFAQRLLQEGITPRQGKKSDQAHPPIHPTKYSDFLQGNEARVYEFVVRHFLACLSKNAEGHETVVEIDIADEKFTATGLQILAKNYLEVYIYDKWNSKEIHIYELGQTFGPTSIDMVEESTSPPNLLTEADLIALMDKYGIGTDATHAEHIETIKSRQYVGLKDSKYLIPGKLGIGLTMGYDRMGFHMSKPHLRAELENDLKLICDRQKQPNEVLQSQISKYRQVFREALMKANLIDIALSEYLDERPVVTEEVEISEPVDDVPILKCPKCNSNMVLKTKRQGNGKYIGCLSYPTCNNVIWFPESVENIEILNERCNSCPDNILKKVKVTFARNAYPCFGTSYSTCIGGCDDMFNNALSIRANAVRRPQDLNDTGYQSNASSRSSQVLSTGRSIHGASNITSNRTISQNQTGNAQQNLRSRSDDNKNYGNSRSNVIIRNTSTNNRYESSNSWGQNNTTLQSSRPGPSSARNHMTFNWNNDGNDEIMCNCHQLAKQLTVRKDGPNQGRKFYKCAKPVGEDCDFFLWDNDANDLPSSGAINNVGLVVQHSVPNSWNQSQNNTFQNNIQNYQNSSHSRQNYLNSSVNRQNNQNSFNISGNWNNVNEWNPENEVMCNCGNPAKKLKVSKEGPNKGRHFYGCPQGPGSHCNFFQWADDNDGGGNSRTNQNDWSRRGRGRTAGSIPKKSRAGAPGGSKRKCGVCGIEGHTRRTCPQNDMD